MNLIKKITGTFAVLAFFSLQLKAQESPVGSWKAEINGATAVLIITPSYFSFTLFNETEKKFLTSYGGTWALNGAMVDATIEFNTSEKEQVGQKVSVSGKLENGKFVTGDGGDRLEWSRIDNGTGALAGDWRISAREQEGKMNPIQPSARKTVKILSGTRFQWIAINTQTGEFFGTGGGTYTFTEGAYTEKIEFFSRDSSRVGASLSFKGKVDGNNWDHSGLSSKGDPIHEVWTRQQY